MAHERVKVSGNTLGNDEELRILLIGKSGDGKSATGNMILGFEAFKSSRSANSVTDVCSCEYGERFGRKLMVVDTPGLCDTFPTNAKIRMELMRSLGLTAPGFHAIIYVLYAGRFTKECLETKNLFFEYFGSNVEKHAMIILTNWCEKNEGHPSKHFEEHNELRDFLKSCGNRVVGFNNDREDEAEQNEQVKRMISVIDDIIKENNNRYFTTFAFRLVQKCIQLDELPVFRWIRNKILPAVDNTPEEKKQDAPKTQRQQMSCQSNQIDGSPFDVCHAAKVNEQLAINKVKRLARDFENTLLQQRDGTLHDFYTTTKEKKPVKFLASSEEAKEKHVMKQDALMFRQQPMTIQFNQKDASSLDVSTTKKENKEAEVLMSSDEVKENPLPYVCMTAEEVQQVEDLLQNDKDVNKSKKDDKTTGNMVFDNSKKDFKATRNKFFDNSFVKRIMKIYDVLKFFF